MMTVNEVSKLTGVSIRTLQYYDTIGLLKPDGYTASGYRLYDDTALERLQQILERHYAEKLSDPSDRKMVERVKAALVRKGYSFSEIQAAVQRYWEETEP